MPRCPVLSWSTTTTAGRWWTLALSITALVLAPACRAPQRPEAAKEPETLSRTEFTDRIENFFEHEPLTPGKPSRFLIHLTDLSDGSPVEKADVTLTVRPASGGGTGAVTKAKVGRVTGIYVAEVTVPGRDNYTIEFQIKNARVDERMTLAAFTAQ
jgi:hypothetical protein